MQFTITLAIFIAATATSAAPTAEMTKRRDTIPFNFYSGAGCNTGTAVTTAYVPTDGSCFLTSPIFSGNTDSALILPLNLASLPAGGSVVAYSDDICSSVSTILYTVTGSCGTFGPGKPIISARTICTCH